MQIYSITSFEIRLILQCGVFANFQFDHFLKSKIDSESIFEMRMSLFLF